MDFTNNYANSTDDITRLFQASFAASEGEVIAGLVAGMFATVPEQDIFVFSALEGAQQLGAIIFTRMRYPQDDRTVFILSPVAIATDQQGKGIGQALIRHGLDHLRAQGVDVVLTYGDINFYAKVGFAQITEDTAAAPLPLSYPEGWLGQALTGGAFVPLKGGSSCVPALSDPALW